LKNNKLDSIPEITEDQIDVVEEEKKEEFEEKIILLFSLYKILELDEG